MKVRFIGDVHGKYHWYKQILKNSPYPTIQVGDMGVGFSHIHGGEIIYNQNPPYDLMARGEFQHRFIRGNHDNPDVCKRHTQWIADGTVENDVMFIGGGFSIDRAYRTEGFDWWSDEECSTAQLNIFTDTFATVQPKIMVTHDCPESVAEIIVKEASPRSPKLDPRFASRTRQAFQSMFEKHQPEVWFFGHWHVPFDKVINGTRFICLAELETFDQEV